jgi:hypothetical protein
MNQASHQLEEDSLDSSIQSNAGSGPFNWLAENPYESSTSITKSIDSEPYHSLWSLNLSGQGLTEFPIRLNMPAALGYLNLSHNRLGMTAVETILNQLQLVMHFVIMGNPACLGEGFILKISKTPMRTKLVKKPNLNEIRKCMIGMFSNIWCLDGIFITRKDELEAHDTMLHLHPALACFLSQPGLIPTRIQQKQLRVAQEGIGPWSPWGYHLLLRTPHAIDPETNLQWAQLHSLAADWRFEMENTLYGKESNSTALNNPGTLGQWIQMAMDHPDSCLLLFLSGAVYLDTFRFPKGLVLPCTTQIFELLEWSPCTLAEWFKLDRVVLLKCLSLILAVMELEQGRLLLKYPLLFFLTTKCGQIH